MKTPITENSLKIQNRLLKIVIALGGLTLIMGAAKDKSHFREIDVERINVVTPDGRREMVIANRDNLPEPIINGESRPNKRKSAGILFYNGVGDESGGLIWRGQLNEKGQVEQGTHFSMDRFGGDQQLALGHYENHGHMETGLTIFDRGLHKDYSGLWDAMQKAPPGPEKEALRQQWIAAGGAQTTRLFVGRAAGNSAALALADGKGRPRIMIYVTSEGEAVFNFLDENGKVVQSLAPKAGEAKK